MKLIVGIAVVFFVSCRFEEQSQQQVQLMDELDKAEIMDPIIFRTDYSNDELWHSVCAKIVEPDPVHSFKAYVTFDEGEEFEKQHPDQLEAELPRKYKEYFGFYFVVDSLSLYHPDQPILCVKIPDVYSPGKDQFRATPSTIGMIESNLRIANMGFEEFSGAVDENGIFRGF